MFDDFLRILSGVSTSQSIKKCHPDEMSDHNNDDHFQEDRKLTGDGPFVSKAAEGAGNEYRKDRDNNTGNNFQNDFLEFLQKLCGSF